MPEMDGLQAAAEIRASEQGTGRHIPIIAMTAYALKGDRERCLGAGMDGYEAKPVRIGELLAAIGAVLPASRRSGSAPATPSPPTPLPQGARGTLAAEDGDWSEALVNVGGDRKLLVELARIFLGASREWLENVHTAVSTSNPVRLEQASHLLKGALSQFGARAAYEAAQQLEMMGKKSDLAGVPAVLATLIHEVERLQPALEALTRETC
jgi:HPt (histidine-containing phosphotransfer) domain-containing protein